MMTVLMLRDMRKTMMDNTNMVIISIFMLIEDKLLSIEIKLILNISSVLTIMKPIR